MLVRFQYVDWTEWEGPPETAAQSPDKGVIRMWAVDDEARQVEFVYDDFYFLYPGDDGTWVFGSGTPKREFVLRPGVGGSEVIKRPVCVPPGTVVRRGQTVSQDEAIRFGLVSAGGKLLSPIYEVQTTTDPPPDGQVPIDG